MKTSYQTEQFEPRSPNSISFLNKKQTEEN